MRVAKTLFGRISFYAHHVAVVWVCTTLLKKWPMPLLSHQEQIGGAREARGTAGLGSRKRAACAQGRTE